jgi:hypothetical protein
MQVGQIKERLVKIEQSVDQAAQACLLSPSVPDDLRGYIGDLERESDQVRQMIEVETAEDRLRECVDRLEDLGDRAMKACNTARILDDKVQRAVTEVHDMISTLKHQLH